MRVEVTLENGESLIFVKRSGGDFGLVEATERFFVPSMFSYKMIGLEPKPGEKLKGIFVSNYLAEGQSGITGTWCLESKVSNVSDI